MKTDRRRAFAFYGAAALVICLLAVSAGRMVQKEYVDVRRTEADRLLEFYSENLKLTLQEQLNYAREFAAIDPDIEEHMQWFRWRAEEILGQKAVLSILVFNGDKVQIALPDTDYNQVAGRDLKDFSYIYTLAKVVKAPVVEGPVMLPGTDRDVFLFLQPLLDGTEYRGEVVIALDEAYVISQMDLGRLEKLGYEYHLWKVSSEDGSKDVVASSNYGLDYSYAAKTEFSLPSNWTLSILPKEGWISARRRQIIMGSALLLGIVLSTLIICVCIFLRRSMYYKRLRWRDRQTGFFNREGFCREINRWIAAGKNFTLFYFSIEEYSRYSLIAGEQESGGIEHYIKSISGIMNDYIKSPFIAGRVAEAGYMVAVNEDMAEEQKLDFAKGLSLQLMWKIRFDGRKIFLKAGYDYVSCQASGQCAEELFGKLAESYHRKLSQESPIHDLTEKCRQLAEGNVGVEFSEYTDPQMMELSKVLNQYRKQVEQVTYYDPVFNIGNRMKYRRDVEMLISYDPKRHFRLYGIDIRSFSKYNELFSVMTGDALLMEVTCRLKQIFGANLYRINGDVFMGISFDHADKSDREDQMVFSIQAAFGRPIQVKDSTFTLDALIGICDYPANARTSESLLECVQAAVDYAKSYLNGEESGVMVYNGPLREIRRREQDILNILKRSIEESALEVWYQPLYHQQSGRFTAAEALVRLPDGKGGYIPAGQMIDIAERNGMVGQVGEYVMNRACTFMRDKGELLGLESMGINLSVQQLLVENSVDRILSQIKETGVDPRRITLEITETVLIQSIDQAKRILEELSALGMRIALDDFGIGFSSLNYLLNLPVHALKIDRTMTQRITGSLKQYALLKAITDMADINRIDVVVEGVETEQELELIAAAKVTYIQGFYYSKPLPGERLEQFLKSRQ